MKTSLIALAGMLLVTSCSKYQINLVSSSNISKDQETGQFKMENDSVKITYSFLGSNTAMQLSVFNKLNEPLYIDWGRSSLIVDSKAYSYADNSVQLSGDISNTTIGNKNFSITQGDINATATLPKDVSFIPPHTAISNNLTGVANYSSNTINDSLFVKTKLAVTGNDGQDIVAKSADFTYQNSPVRFENYLTLYTLNGNTPKLTALQHDFYVSRIIKTLVNPHDLQFLQQGRSDYYYTSQATTYGKIATGTVVAASLADVAAIDASQQQKAQ
jgi:hypothetical protein